MVKNLPSGDLGLMPGLGKISWRRAWQLTPVFLPRELHGQRSLAGCSPRGRRESDMTERLTHTHPGYNKAMKGQPVTRVSPDPLSQRLPSALQSQAGNTCQEFPVTHKDLSVSRKGIWKSGLKRVEIKQLCPQQGNTTWTGAGME